MAELKKKYLLDADIIADFNTKQLRFENEEPFFCWKNLKTLLIVSGVLNWPNVYNLWSNL